MCFSKMLISQLAYSGLVPQQLSRIFGHRSHLFRRKYSASKAKTKSETKKWESVIGLEVHAQILSNSKLFSSAGINFLSMTNELVSLFDAAIPGTLPVLNSRCVEAAVLTSLALKANINKVSTFDRKHYFYADMPAGYQITQQRNPIARNGHLDFVVYNPSVHKKPFERHVSVTQIQIEQDSGKSLHDSSSNRSLIDLNRAGIGLIEIVFGPDLKDGEEAAALIKELCMILKSHGICSCKMEEGALRVDANVSVNRPGEPLGTRSEVKNINSIRGVCKAIEFEIERQIELKENGEDVLNETRNYDPVSKTTTAMRDKEVIQDYRYMPEPNLPPLRLSDNNQRKSGQINIDVISERLQPLPGQIRTDLVHKFGLKLEQSAIIISVGLLELFLELVKTESRSPISIVNFLLQHFLAELNECNIDVEESKVDANTIGDIIDSLSTQTITLATAKQILKLFIDGESRSVSEIIIEENMHQITDASELGIYCDKTIQALPDVVKKYKNGKSRIINVLIDDVKIKSNYKANMKLVAQIMKSKLDAI